MRYLIIVLIAILTIAGCRQDTQRVRQVDFSERASDEGTSRDLSVEKTLKVAVSAMSSPRETFSYYEDIIRFISEKLDMPYEFHQRRTYDEVNNMLETGQLDFAFICTGAYVELNPDSGVQLLSIPVTRGKTVYQAYLIVPEGSSAEGFADLKGLSFAYTDLLSNTGYLYTKYRLTEIGEDPNTFFSSTVFTNAHDVSIQMVAKGLIDGASIHGMVFDYLRANEPERVRGVRIIEISEDYGIPPVVASSRMSDDLKAKVRTVLQNMHLDGQGIKLINNLLIDEFTDGDDADYDGVREMRSALEDKFPE